MWCHVFTCVMLLNFSIWAVVIAAGLVSAVWSLMLGPSRITITPLWYSMQRLNNVLSRTTIWCLLLVLIRSFAFLQTAHNLVALVFRRRPPRFLAVWNIQVLSLLLSRPCAGYNLGATYFIGCHPVLWRGETGKPLGSASPVWHWT